VLAEVCQQSVGEIRAAHRLSSDLAETARLAREGRLTEAGLVPFRPVKFMLAEPETRPSLLWQTVQSWAKSPPAGALPSSAPTAAELSLFPAPAWAASPSIWVEYKYEGLRCQLHKVGRRVAVYSRDLQEWTAALLGWTDGVETAADDFILDGEWVALRQERVLPLAELRRRLQRPERDLFLAREIPIEFIAFDLLWWNGRQFSRLALRERREALEAAQLGPVRVAPRFTVASLAELEQAFARACEQGHEGLVVKQPMSVYTPGQRGPAWLKLKPPGLTLECAVVRAEWGRGKREHLLTEFTVAVRDETSGAWVPVGRVVVGLTENERRALTEHFRTRTVAREGRVLVLEPDVIFEVAFAAVEASMIHPGGCSLLAPRVVQVHRDRPVDSAASLADVRRCLPT
jgi:DNA ligase 1